MIVSTVLDHTCNADNVELITANTGLLIMLIYFWKSLMGQTIMRTEATKKYKVIERDFGVIAECIGDVRKYLTFVHAFGGCDTTSAIYGQSKLSILKLLEKSKAAREETVFQCFTRGSFCNALWWKKFWFINLSEIYKIYENGFICSKCEACEFALNRTSCYVSYVPGILSTPWMEHTHGKYLRAKRLGVEIRRCLVGTIYDRSRTCPRWASKCHKMQLPSNVKKAMQWKTMFLSF